MVITVPAYFDEPRRKGTTDAGEMAGLKVLDIVNEPTAAALSFGEVLGYLTPRTAVKEKMTILVYDLGGGTFDATLLRLSPGKIETIATDGDVQLGGHDWDLRLVDHLADRFRKLHKRDPRQDPVLMNRMLAAAIDAKHALSARGRTTVRLELAGQVMEIPVSREQFEEMTADLLERTAYTTRQLLTAAGMEWKDITRLLLVGGSTRMPMVVAMLRNLSGLEPDHTVHPDEAVARGAALYAAFLLAKESGDKDRASFAITNVNSHSLGVEGIDPETLRKRNVVLIPRNTPLPATCTERFTTRRENQRSIALQVLEGESGLPGECTAIGRTVIRNLPEGLPKNWPVDVTFEYASSGRLTVSALVPGTHQGATLDLERAVGMSDDSIARWKQPIGAAAGFDDFEAMVQDVLQLSAGGGAETAPQPTAADIKPRPAVAPADSPAAAPVEPAKAASAAPRREGWSPFAAAAGAAESSAGAAVELPPQPESLQAEGDEPSQGEEPAAESDDAVFAIAVAKRPPLVKPAPTPPIPRWLFNMIGHAIAGLLGLALGYLILHHLRPETFPLPW